MGSSVPAQSHLSSATGGGQADRGKREIRFQLVDGDRDGMFPGGVVLWSYFGIETEENDADFWAHAVSNEICDYRDDVHVGARICDAVFRDGCGAGAGVHADRVVLSVFRDVHWLAGRGADGERHFVERLVWRITADYRGAAQLEPDSDVRVE